MCKRVSAERPHSLIKLTPRSTFESGTRIMLSLLSHNRRVTHITLVAVVGWLVFHAALVTDFLPCSHQLVSQNLDVLDGLQQAVSECLREKETEREGKTVKDVN